MSSNKSLYTKGTSSGQYEESKRESYIDFTSKRNNVNKPISGTTSGISGSGTYKETGLGNFSNKISTFSRPEEDRKQIEED